ncbi:hypothetical protein O3G_MSEX010029 [Manduca sexta]|uniref:Uncharacterized protein n=1 Tax=Manduca sexta TaxID=7130 RepID=A0A922CT48_MANSE|nr:hypothetical protein O3G_MSEX010029 [Manduca sexta]KAG6456933.1 hypothetical protein O3G_MSEX010029 [Manduca sexta]
MNACVEEYDEDIHDDLIKLCFKLPHSDSCCYLGSSMHKNVTNMPDKTQIETIDLTGANDPVNIKMPKPLSIKNDVCYQIKQLAIEIVDFKKFPWYYKKYIKYYNNTEDINSTNGIVVCEDNNNTNDMCMKIKYDNNKGQWKVQEGNKDTSSHIKDRVVSKTKFHRNLNKIDFKRNKGLVGLTITQKFITEDIVVKKEDEESSSLDKLNDETDVVIIDNLLNTNGLSNKIDKETKETSDEIVVIENSGESIASKCENNKIIETFKRNDDLNKSQPTKIIKKSSKDVSNLKATPRKNKINLIDETSCRTYTKPVINFPSSEKPLEIQISTKNKQTNILYITKRDSETVARQQKKDKKERKQFAEDKTREPKSNIDKIESNKKRHAPTIKKIFDTIKVRKDIFNEVKSLSEREVAVIDSASKQLQNINKFNDKATKLTPKHKLKSVNIEGAKYNEPKPLDMPILTEENYETSEVPSIRRTSFKDSIVFENDVSSIEEIPCKETSGKKIAKSSNQQPLEKNSLEVLKSPQANNSTSSIAELASTTPATVVSTVANIIPVISYVNSGVSKPRVKYTPVTKDYAIPTNTKAASNQGTHARFSQSFLSYSSPAAVNSPGHNAQNRSMVQLLTAPQRPPNMGTTQHRLPLQQMPNYSVPPSPYPSNYPILPSYEAAVANIHLPTGHRTFGNNVGDRNLNYHYMNAGHGAPLPHLPLQQAPQWQPNTNFNQTQPLQYQINLQTPNCSSAGWNNGYVRGINNVASSAPCMATNTATGNQRVHFDILRAHTQPEPTNGKPSKSNAPKTPIRKNTDKHSQASLEQVNGIAINNNSKKTSKRPYEYGVHEVNRQHSLLEKELTKRPKTAPLISEDARTLKSSEYSPPILPIPTNEMVLSNFFISTQPSNAQENTPRNAKNATSKTPTEPMDKSRKISIEDYKKRVCKNDSADVYNSAVRTGDNTKGTGHEPNATVKKTKYGNYLEQDLGYSSDTTVKL